MARPCEEETLRADLAQSQDDVEVLEEELARWGGRDLL